MTFPAIANETLLRRLNLGVLVAGAALAIVASGLGLSILLINGSVGRADRDRLSAVARERAADATLTRSKRVRTRKLPVRVDQQVEVFATAFAKACREEGVTFSSFDNGADATPYASRYGTKPEAIDWKASEARVSIQGRLADIYTVLGKLKGLPVPFEVEAGTLESVPGTGQVRVGLTIAAIVREEKRAGRG